MRFVEPQVFLVGETRIIQDTLDDCLEYIGAADWDSDAPTDVEKLIEVDGRLCYKSFKVELNPNLTRVRKHNSDYLRNTLEKGDGSIFEHSVLNFIFVNVSRVFTHELVRHRVGVAISQESLRFVRLVDLGLWIPFSIREYPEAVSIMVNAFKYLERKQKELARILDLDNPNKKFEEKKKLTSAMRRIAPMGLATVIGWSANIRTLRHVIEMRTNPGAEEEIRYVFGKVAEIVRKRYPNLFADYEIKEVDGLPWWYTPNKKV
jgi:thymidylate synthase (FAD)